MARYRRDWYHLLSLFDEATNPIPLRLDVTVPSSSIKPTPPPPRPGRPEAADAVWPWRAGHRTEAAGHELAMPAALARREGMLRGVIGGVIGTLVFFFWHANLAWVVWGLAGFTFLAAAVSPTGLYRGIQRVVEAIATGIGVTLTWILLPLLFYGFCLPFGLLTRRGMKDKLERWFDQQSPSYWKTRRDPEREAVFYERQF